MTCKEFASLTDIYLRASLSEEQQEAFELHYFECDGCFARLKAVERLHKHQRLNGRNCGNGSHYWPPRLPSWWWYCYPPLSSDIPGI
jgi:hypothetical protein